MRRRGLIMFKVNKVTIFCFSYEFLHVARRSGPLKILFLKQKQLFILKYAKSNVSSKLKNFNCTVAVHMAANIIISYQVEIKFKVNEIFT